jgi:putative ABC transport system permease protein
VIKADDREVVVVGVMPQGFTFPLNSQYWLPQSRALIVDWSRARRLYQVIGRLADGVTEAEARADLEALTARLAITYPSTNAGLRPVVGRYSNVQTMGLRTYLSRLLIAIVFVLLIGCANVASLLLARSAQRAREMALRVMLGATRWRLIRQLLAESTLLAFLSGAVGIGISAIVLPFFASGVTKPYWMEWAMDGRVLAVLIATCLGTGVLFGIAPALHVSNTSLYDVAKDSGRLGGGGARARRWTTGLLAVELALTLTLLSSVGLVLRGFLLLYSAGQTVDASGLMTMQVRLGVERYGKQEQRRAFFEALQQQLTQMPEVADATLASELPVAGGGRQRLSIDARPTPPGGPPTFVTYLTIDSRYFETLGLPLLKGRPFDSVDGTTGNEGAIVNQRFVEMFFPDQDPIGQRIRLSNPNVVMQAPPPVTIVGVSPTVRQSLWVTEQPDPVVYVPLRVNSAYWVHIIARPRTNVETLVSAVRTAVSRLDPEMPLFDIMSLEQAMARSRGFQRSIVLMLGVFAAIAVLLASVGIYAVTAYAVAQRRQEVGLRMALGARATDVVTLFVRRAIFPLAIGVIAGAAGAAIAGRLLGNWLADRASFDLTTLAAVAMLLSLVTLAAALLPSWRAARLDPNAALRCE